MSNILFQGWKLNELLKYNDQHHICKKFPGDQDFDVGHADICRVKIKVNMVLLIEKIEKSKERFIDINVNFLHKARAFAS